MSKYLLVFMLAVSLFACSEPVVPKPYGELRLEYPQPRYQVFDGAHPFSFEVSDFAKVQPAERPEWFNITYPQMQANVFLTYFPIHGDLKLHIKEAEKMVYEHTIKASAINTRSFNYPEKRVFGNFYELQGKSASNIQFYITDSTRHFVTANLYFNSRPRPDSLAPAVDYIKTDLEHLIDTFKWKN